MIVYILLVLSFLAIGVLFWILNRLTRRLLEFDDLFEMLSHDIDVNVGYFESISDHPVLGNAEEIVTADRNMRIMRARLDEYVASMEELTRRKLRKQKEVPNLNPPVVR